jgi:hypothetical protein
LIVKNSTLCRYGVFKVHADRARPTQEGRRSAGLSKLNSEVLRTLVTTISNFETATSRSTLI